jgi:hypothetical protein
LLRDVHFALQRQLPAAGVLLPVYQSFHFTEQRTASVGADIGPAQFLADVLYPVVAAPHFASLVVHIAAQAGDLAFQRIGKIKSVDFFNGDIQGYVTDGLKKNPVMSPSRGSHCLHDAQENFEPLWRTQSCSPSMPANAIGQRRLLKAGVFSLNAGQRLNSAAA